MRQLALAALVIWALAASVAALEIEDHRRFGPAEAPQVLRVVSTGDVALFAPILAAFIADRPGVAIDYTVASSAELARAIGTQGVVMDVAISSAMDLQTQLVNDGFARAHRSPATGALPRWARWRDHLFAFSQEPAAIVLSRPAFDGLPLPRTRQDLIALLRDHPERFAGRVGTYDIRTSGLGYLFATQDARASEVYWRLAEVMGARDVRLYCCSGQMIEDVAAGRLALAYNVLGSYVPPSVAEDGDLAVILPEDFTTVMLRTVFVPENSPSPELAGDLVDFLVSGRWTVAPGVQPGLAPVAPAEAGPALRRIRLGPGLLVYLDGHKRRSFLAAWRDAVLQ